MTNEERAEMLALMQEAVKPINDRLDKLEQGQVKLEQGQAQLEQNIADIKQVQLNSVVSDNEIKQKLGVLLDGMKGIQDRFDRQDKTEQKVENLQDRVSAIEYKLKQA